MDFFKSVSSESSDTSREKISSSKNVIRGTEDKESFRSNKKSQHDSGMKDSTSQTSSPQMQSAVHFDDDTEKEELPKIEDDSEEAEEIRSRFTDQVNEARPDLKSKSESGKENEKKGIKILERLGFRKKETEPEKDDPKDEDSSVSMETFEKTFKKFPQAMVSGKKISTSYILPKKHKTETFEDVRSENDGPVVLKQMFDEKAGEEKEPPERKFFKKEPFSESLKSILKKKSHDSVESTVIETDQNGQDKSIGSSKGVSSGLEDKVTEKSLLKHSVKFLSEMPDKTPSKEGIDSDVYKRHSAVLPQISSEGKVVYGTHQVTEEQLAIGEKGFIAQLLLDVMREHKPKIPKKASLYKTDSAERRRAVAEADNEIKAYFYTPIKSVSLTSAKSAMLKSKATLKSLKSKAVAQIPGSPVKSEGLTLAKSALLKSRATILNLKSMAELQTTDVSPSPKLSPAPDAKPPSVANLTTEWRPGSLTGIPEESVIALHQRKQSWVGPYVIGTDYWTKVEATAEEPEKVAFGMDCKQRPWYDVYTSGSHVFHTGQKKELKVTRKKLEALKKKLPETEVEYQKKNVLRDTEKGGSLPTSWNDDLKDMFQEFAKNSELNKNRISLADVDKWLEMVEILDFVHLTLIQTGFCFYAAGGTRYKGLTFPEFKTFLMYVANASKMPFSDVVSRLKLAQLGIAVTKDDYGFKLT